MAHDRVYGIEHVSQIARGHRCESGHETPMAERTDAVGELGSTGRRVGDCRSLKQARSMKAKQTSLRFMDMAVDQFAQAVQT